MACTDRTNVMLQQKSKRKIETATSPLEKLTHICLARGANGIVGIGRQFRIIDDDGDKKLSFKEFCKGCNDFGANLTKEEITEIFQSIDKDGSGSVDFEEFLKALRPPMNKSRMDIVNRAFVKLDKTKDGVIKLCISYDCAQKIPTLSAVKVFRVVCIVLLLRARIISQIQLQLKLR
ncbi:hypothetical protein AHF37_12815 [Paragonimus kellicotti]|nr:hypothetical protein AHF37_12815 [Paragonimus kellicotti]